MRATQRKQSLVALCALFVLGAALALGWAAIGAGNPIYGLVVACGTFAIGPLLGNPLARLLPARCFRVTPGERTVHRALGVAGFGSLLEHSGWNRAIADPMRSFDGTRADLPSLVRDLRGNISAHGTGFLIHFGLAASALLTGHPWGTAWILLPGVLIHLYPVLLQRSITLRVQPLLVTVGTRGDVP